MKGSTKVFAAVRNVGDANDSGEVFEGTTLDMIRWFAGWIAKCSLATRVDLAIGRNAESVERRIIASKAMQSADSESFLDEVELIMARTSNPEAEIESTTPAVDGDTYED